ncbi:MAG: 50S ribosomal protein L17 [Thermodesulfobacteriota bacterium]
MRHRVANRKLGRTTSHRMAMLRNMASSLLLHERIRTTNAKAKELRGLVERMITLGKQGDLRARRRAASFVRGAFVTRKLFSELADRYRQVQGGYTRIIKVGPRRGDGAMMSLVELVPVTEATSAPRKKGSKRGTARRRPSKAPEGKGKKGPASASQPEK